MPEIRGFHPHPALNVLWRLRVGTNFGTVHFFRNALSKLCALEISPCNEQVDTSALLGGLFNIQIGLSVRVAFVLE